MNTVSKTCLVICVRWEPEASKQRCVPAVLKARELRGHSCQGSTQQQDLPRKRNCPRQVTGYQWKGGER
ncbi:hypothetical protein E2C01_068690 [Portunus trituberculatus]|uniref:Uncharacterized protein n=1 Tax=Portunus trituberculatus TaxID=210409 RepID=A0A5B7HWK7_PORTR|nr:hypothetical protein [Portunus trituberculatus]